MLTQDIWKRLTPPTFRVTNLSRRRHRARATRSSWKFLSITDLENFESVSDQFSDFGLHFEEAIAIRPSNPKFLAQGCQRAIMAINQGKTLKIDLEPTVLQANLWVVSSQEVTVSALNAKGHCAASAKTADAETSKANKLYREQNVMIDASTAQVLRIDSKSPFIVTQFAVKQRR